MPITRIFRSFYHCPISFTVLLCFLLTACSSGDSNDNDNNEVAPEPVTNLVANRGDTKISLGWDHPDDGGVSYVVDISPNVGTITQFGRTAIVEGLSNGTNYTVSVRTQENGLSSTPVTTQLSPAIVNTNNYSAINIGNDPSLSGIFDPSFYRDGSGTIWMAYSGVDYYQDGSFLVQDVSTRIARSDDNGASYTLVTTLGAPSNASATDTSNTLGCTNNQCEGRWVYEVPVLIDDASDPNSSQRFKIYAHKYLLIPSANPATIYFLGAIVRWTAPTPDSTWSAEEVVMRWNLSPPELNGGVNLNTLNSALNDCILFSEGGASTGTINSTETIDFVFICPYLDSNTSSILQRVVQLRSNTHGSDFNYIGTPLVATDATQSAAQYYSAPALLPQLDSAPVLLATPVVNGLYAGCVVFPYANFENGGLMKTNNQPIILQTVSQLTSNFGGACSWDRGMETSGLATNNFDLNNSLPFSILATQQGL